MSYMRGKLGFVGCFWNGKLVVDGRQFDTLSQAAPFQRVKEGDDA